MELSDEVRRTLRAIDEVWNLEDFFYAACHYHHGYGEKTQEEVLEELSQEAMPWRCIDTMINWSRARSNGFSDVDFSDLHHRITEAV